jgi:hypothetical protein
MTRFAVGDRRGNQNENKYRGDETKRLPSNIIDCAVSGETSARTTARTIPTAICSTRLPDMMRLSSV